MKGLLRLAGLVPSSEFFLDFGLPSFNDMESARGKTDGDRAWNAYNDKKQALQRDIVNHIRSQRPRRVDAPALILFEWQEKDRRRDPDNIAAGGRKIILDAMAEPRANQHGPTMGAGLIHCDGWHCAAPGFADVFRVGRRAGVKVVIYGDPKGRER